jgi:chromosome segregation ATPase
MTEKEKRKAETTLEDLDAKIQEMEAELEDGCGELLSWDEVTSTTAEEIAASEQRRGILPRLIKAAKVKRLELEKRGHEERATSIGEERDAAYATFQEQEERLREAKAARDDAHDRWMVLLSAVNSVTAASVNGGLPIAGYDEMSVRAAERFLRKKASVPVGALGAA